MHFAGSVPWSMSWDTPEVLQFAAFIGQQENFSPYPKIAPKSQAEAEWQEWWLNAPEQFTEAMANFTEAVRNKNRTGQLDSQLLQKGHPRNFGWNPPEFSFMDDAPELRKLCISYWPQFSAIHDALKMQIIDQYHQQMNRLEIQKIVKEIEKRRIRRIKAFRLNVNFVPWPIDH